jgi:hypothetical protein
MSIRNSQQESQVDSWKTLRSSIRKKKELLSKGQLNEPASHNKFDEKAVSHLKKTNSQMSRTSVQSYATPPMFLSNGARLSM